MLDVDFTCTRNVGYLCSAFHRARVIYVWFYLGVLGVFSWNLIPDNGKSGWWATRILFAGVPLARACLLSIWLSSQSHKNWLALRFLGLDSWPSSRETHMWQVSGKRVARDTSVRGHDTWIFFKPLDLHFKYRFLVVGREAQVMFRQLVWDCLMSAKLLQLSLHARRTKRYVAICRLMLGVWIKGKWLGCRNCRMFRDYSWIHFFTRPTFGTVWQTFFSPSAYWAEGKLEDVHQTSVFEKDCSKIAKKWTKPI